MNKEPKKIRKYSLGEAATFLLHHVPIVALFAGVAAWTVHPVLPFLCCVTSRNRMRKPKETFEDYMKVFETICVPEKRPGSKKKTSEILDIVDDQAKRLGIKKTVETIIPQEKDRAKFLRAQRENPDELFQYFLDIARGRFENIVASENAQAYCLKKDPRIIISPLLAKHGASEENRIIIGHELAHLQPSWWSRNVPMMIASGAVADAAAFDAIIQPLYVLINGGLTQESLLLAGKVLLVDMGFFWTTQVVEKLCVASSRRNEIYMADKRTIMLTENPEAAITALYRLGKNELLKEVREHITAKNTGKWFEYGVKRIIKEHPPVGKRLDRIRKHIKNEI